MRELKFKFWNKLAHRFQAPNKYAIQGDGLYVSYDYDMMAWDDPSSFDDSILVPCQYTGLKDAKGKEIYEGDILKFHKSNSPQKNKEDYLCKDNKKVVWGLDYGQYPYAGWTVISLKPTDLEDGYPLNHMDQRNMEVIGNIFENSDLLKQ
jgi:uncharacterized phage protein (TIGR01671 family)